MSGPKSFVAIACVALAARAAVAGSFLGAGEPASGDDVVMHAPNYFGTGGPLEVSLCTDVPAMEIPVRNIAHTVNGLGAVIGNVQPGAVPSGQPDFETIGIHELGHCLGLGHVNRPNRFTYSREGPDGVFTADEGADGVPGTSDDSRGDDVNLFWFRLANDDPFSLPRTVDATSYSRAVAALPTGGAFPTAPTAIVSELRGLPLSAAIMNVPRAREFGDAIRRLAPDDVAMLRYAASGVDELAGTDDDYVLRVSFSSSTDPESCDVKFTFVPGLAVPAVCDPDTFFPFVDAPDHGTLVNQSIARFDPALPWFFNGTLDETAQCAGLPATIIGTPGPNRIYGTDGPDVIVGGRGNDTILGRGGDDVVCGGPGSDVLKGGGGDDELAGGPGGDTLRGGAGTDACTQGGGFGAEIGCP